MGALHLNGLESLTETQAKFLGEVDQLSLNSLTTLTDQQATNLSRVQWGLSLQGLALISDAQAKALEKVDRLSVPQFIQEKIDKIKQTIAP